MKRYVMIIFIFLLIPTLSSAQAPSIYEVKTGWKDIHGNQTGVGIAKGSYTLISMVYTGCAHSCPLTISKIQSIEKAFKKAGLPEVKFVLASFDVKKDRPEKLKVYTAHRKLDPKKWIFLSADQDADARQLAVILGMSYKDIGEGDFSHSNTITLLDPSGVPLASLENLNADNDILVQAIIKDQQKK